MRGAILTIEHTCHIKACLLHHSAAFLHHGHEWENECDTGHHLTICQHHVHCPCSAKMSPVNVGLAKHQD